MLFYGSEGVTNDTRDVQDDELISIDIRQAYKNKR